jgi:hypothetical protein
MKSSLYCLSKTWIIAFALICLRPAGIPAQSISPGDGVTEGQIETARGRLFGGYGG